MLKIIASNFFVRFFSAIANLILAVIISQYLGADGKGEQSIILATITIILLFDNLIGGASIVYLTPRMGLKNLLFTSYLWSILISLVCLIIMLIIPGFSIKHLISIAILSGINSIASINSSVLIGKEKIQRSNLINFSIPFLTLFAIIYLFSIGKENNVFDYLTALYLAYGFAALLSLFFVFQELEKSDGFSIVLVKSTFKALFFYGFQNQLAHIFQLMSFRLSYFLLESNSGQKAVGVYSNGLSIVESIWMITSSISIYQYARISNSNNIAYAKELTEKLLKLGISLASLALLVVVLIPKGFYIWMFGSDFYELNVIIRRMAPGILVFNYALILGHFFSGIGKYYVNAIASFVGFLVTLIFSLVYFDQLTVFTSANIAVLSYLSTSLVVIAFYLKEGGKFVFFPRLSEIKLLMNQLGFFNKL